MVSLIQQAPTGSLWVSLCFSALNKTGFGFYWSWKVFFRVVPNSNPVKLNNTRLTLILLGSIASGMVIWESWLELNRIDSWLRNLILWLTWRFWWLHRRFSTLDMSGNPSLMAWFKCPAIPDRSGTIWKMSRNIFKLFFKTPDTVWHRISEHINCSNRLLLISRPILFDFQRGISEVHLGDSENCTWSISKNLQFLWNCSNWILCGILGWNLKISTLSNLNVLSEGEFR